MAQRRITLTGPFDVAATFETLAGKAAGRVSADRTVAWWVTSAPTGPASLRVEVSRGEVCAEAWGDGADWVIDRLPDLCGLGDDPARLAPAPGIVAQLHRRNPGLRLGASGRVFETLVPAILGQRVTSIEARRAYRGLLGAYGSPAPGPLVAMVPPDAATVARLRYADLHPFGVERSRAEVLIEAARCAKRLEEIVTMEPAAAVARLTTVRGVGPWTAAIVMGAACGDPDAVPVGDYHLPHTVAWALAAEPRATDERMLELLEPYRGQRRRVLVLLGRAGFHAPRFGPRTSPRDIAWS